MSKRFFIIFTFFFFCIVTSYAQQIIFNLKFCEWPDGCLTYESSGHYSPNHEHRNDTVFVRNLINEFTNYIKQFNAVSIEQQRSGMVSDYVYQIDKSYLYSLGITRIGSDVTVLEPTENYTMYNYNIYKISRGSGSNGGYSGSSISSSSLSYSPSNSNYILIGYNYSFGMPFGFTIGCHSFYTSWNLNISAYSDGVTSGDGPPDGLTGETTDNGLEFTVGYLFKLKEGVLRLPIGIGMSLTDECQYYHDSAGNEGWYVGDGNLENREFIFEAGLQLILFRFLYIASTYRLIGFSKNGFTIGAGFIF